MVKLNFFPLQISHLVIFNIVENVWRKKVPTDLYGNVLLLVA